MEFAFAILLQHHPLESQVDLFGVLVAAGRAALVRLPRTQEIQKSERGRGDIVVLGLAGAIAAPVLGEFLERPVSIAGLVRGHPFEPCRDGGFRERVAATFAQHLAASGTAAAAKATRTQLATQPARKA